MGTTLGKSIILLLTRLKSSQADNLEITEPYGSASGWGARTAGLLDFGLWPFFWPEIGYRIV